MEKDSVKTPRRFEHYKVDVNKEKIPAGVELWMWDDSAAGLKKIHG